MTPIRTADSHLRFADFAVDLRARELFRGDRRVPLQDRPFEVLVALLEQPGEVVLRQELSERLWPAQVVEFDNNLNTAVTKLRRALDDDAEEPRIIETLPKRGYRLLVPVSAELGAGEERDDDRAILGFGWRDLRLPALLLVLVLLAFFAAQGWRAARTIESPTSAPGETVQRELLVVLPFVAPASDAPLADVLTEEVITRLAELLPPQLGVIARTSAMRFHGTAVDLGELREKLGVSYALEGSFLRTADGFRITTRFIDVVDQGHLWGASFDSELGRLPEIQRSLAERIAAGVAGRLRATGSLPSRATAPPEAWEAYLRGRYLLSLLPSPEKVDLEEAVVSLERSLAVAPDFALAWAALADAFGRMPGPADVWAPRAREAARRALELDPSLAGPHHRLASLALYRDWDWPEAKRQYDLALALAPHLAVLHHSLAAWYSTQGRHAEALDSIDRALDLDPLSVVLQADAGWYLFVAGRYEDAVDRCLQALEVLPDHRGANSYLFHSLLALERREEAAEVATRLLRIEGVSEVAIASVSARSEAAIDALREHRLARLREERRRNEISPGRLALASLAAGRHSEALDLLEEGATLRWGWVYPFLRVYPLFEPIAQEPRYRELVSRIGIPDVDVGGARQGSGDPKSARNRNEPGEV